MNLVFHQPNQIEVQVCVLGDVADQVSARSDILEQVLDICRSFVKHSVHRHECLLLFLGLFVNEGLAKLLFEFLFIGLIFFTRRIVVFAHHNFLRASGCWLRPHIVKVSIFVLYFF